MSLQVNKIDLNDEELISKWDDFVDDSKEGTFYHKSFWLLNNKGSNFKSAQSYDLYYVEDKNKKWMAAFYIPYSKKAGKDFIVMPHMTPFSGIMFSSSIEKLTVSKRIGNKKDINELFIQKLKEKTMLYYSFSPEHVDLQPFIWAKYPTGVRYTYRLQLNDEKIMWSNLQEKTSVNKSKKANVTYKWGKEEYLDMFMELNSQSFEKQGINSFDTALTKRLIENSFKNDSCVIGIIFDEDETPLGGCVLAYDTKRVYYIMGGISRSNNFAMSALLWEAIIHSRDILKLEVFDFEGSMIPSIERYFRKFGGDITPYYTLNNLLMIVKNNL